MTEFLGSARGRTLAVFDTESASTEAIAAIGALGVPADRIEIFSGADGAAAFDGSGRHHGVFGVLYRAIQFTLVDQTPDFAYYEAAARQGRRVVSVKPRNEQELRRVVDAIRANGGHFINHFGLFATEEIERWRGPEPDLPGFMRR